MPSTNNRRFVARSLITDYNRLGLLLPSVHPFTAKLICTDGGGINPRKSRGQMLFRPIVRGERKSFEKETVENISLCPTGKERTAQKDDWSESESGGSIVYC